MKSVSDDINSVFVKFRQDTHSGEINDFSYPVFVNKNIVHWRRGELSGMKFFVELHLRDELAGRHL